MLYTNNTGNKGSWTAGVRRKELGKKITGSTAIYPGTQAIFSIWGHQGRRKPYEQVKSELDFERSRGFT